MSVRDKVSTMDDELQQVFGAPVSELYEAAVGPDVSPSLVQALEYRSFLALTEEQVVRVRDRVHKDMRPQCDMGELSPDKLRFDAELLKAALDARTGYRVGLVELLRTMPVPEQRPRPVRTAQLKATTTMPPNAASAPPSAVAARARRP